MNQITLKKITIPYITSALHEDLPYGDISVDAILSEPTPGSADLLAKESGIICGLPVLEQTFALLDPDIRVHCFFSEGDSIQPGDLLATVSGDMRAILMGERTALNFLQRMSGIATLTRSVVQLLEGSSIQLLDTRKTTPNNRIFEKYAVTVGGGKNHRFNLSDGVMLKDNHISAAGSLTKAVQLAKEHTSFVRKIEVETETLDMVREALEAGADIIMLDNMDLPTQQKALQLIDHRAETEISGNITKENIAILKDLPVDYISSGALTHSAPILDISLKNLHPL